MSLPKYIQGVLEWSWEYIYIHIGIMDQKIQDIERKCNSLENLKKKLNLGGLNFFKFIFGLPIEK